MIILPEVRMTMSSIRFRLSTEITDPMVDLGFKAAENVSSCFYEERNGGFVRLPIRRLIDSAFSVKRDMKVS